MCESGVCESTCSDEVARECPVALSMLASLAVPVKSAVDEAWDSFAAAMDKEDRMRRAVEAGGTGYTLMAGQY